MEIPLIAFIEPFDDDYVVDVNDVTETMEYFNEDYVQYCYYFRLKTPPELRDDQLYYNVDKAINDIIEIYEKSEAYKYVTALTLSDNFEGIFYSKKSISELRKYFHDAGYDKTDIVLRKAFFKGKTIRHTVDQLLSHFCQIPLGLCDAEHISFKQVKILLYYAQNNGYRMLNYL